MKCNRAFIFIILFLMVLFLSACSSEKIVLNGKYIFVEESSIYYSFDGEKNYVTNNLWQDIDISDSGSGTYNVENNKIITNINGDDKYQYEVGYVYDNYICSLWNGKIPDNNTSNTEISSNILNSLYLKFHFGDNGTYEYTVNSNNEIVHTEKGTYSIDKNEVVCISDEGKIKTFINVDNSIYGIEYVKE